MDTDDIIYLICLLTSIAIGPWIKKNPNDLQKIYSTVFGVFIGFVISGWHLFHCLASFAVCALIITKVHPRKSHVICFFLMFGYLVVFRTTTYFGIPEPPGPTNMIQMILTLKIVGVAFEKNASYYKIQQHKNLLKYKIDAETKGIELPEYDLEIQDITIVEMFHYSFNYIGLLVGPYYRYRTYRDYFDTPFKLHADSTRETLGKLKWAVLYALIHLVSSRSFPLNYALTDEFYNQRSFLYRALYIWPQFVTFRFRLYTGLILGESVCTNAGFGAYPEGSQVNKGEGPKAQYLHYKSDPEVHKYNFDTIMNINVYEVETTPTFRKTLREWNICVQYWLALNIYKRFPNKKFRTIATLLTSAFWHGFYPGHYFCIMGGPFYVPVEEIYFKLYRENATGIKQKIIDLAFFISKMFALSYLGMAFVLLDFNKFWRYYSSVYHYGYLYYFFMAGIGFVMLKKTRNTYQKQAEMKLKKVEKQF